VGNWFERRFVGVVADVTTWLVGLSTLCSLGMGDISNSLGFLKGTGFVVSE